jgi:peptidyl-prolyl cis-trans isomerase D
MLKSIQQRDLDKNRWIKITMGVILVIISVTMVLTLIPGPVGSVGDRPDAVATVGGEAITITQVQQQLQQAMRSQTIPEMLRPLYTRQILDQMIFLHALELESQRLGIKVTPEEERDRIKQIIPTAFSGDTWLRDKYTTEVAQRTGGMSVEEFESFLHDQMLQEKFHALVTDGLSVTPQEIEAEFRKRNEKVHIEYALIKPVELAATIHPSDADLEAYYKKNMGKYQIPEKRSTRYALLDMAKLRASTQISEDQLKTYYNAHLDDYKVENKVHVEHILFKTIGKTDAEVEEIRKKAEDVLKQAKKGANFEELAKKYSEDDGTKEKGGDLGWIVEGQTVPEFQKVAFSEPKGAISDLVKTQYGFHIIKVLDRETAHTKTFEEVRSQILPTLLDERVAAEANDLENQMAAAVRQSNRQPIDAIAKKFDLELGQTPAASFTEAVGPLGNAQELRQMVFQLRPGELSSPMQVAAGWVIITVAQIEPGHQGTLAEVHDKVEADYRSDKSVELARTKADQLAKMAQGNGELEKDAKSLDLATKTPDAFARNGTIPDVGSAKELGAAFTMPVGQVSAATPVGGNWVVYKVVGRDEPNPADMAAQTDQLKQDLLQAKQNAAYEAFRTSLIDQLKREGKLTVNAEAVKRLTHVG